MQTIEQIYQQHIKHIPIVEQQRLVSLIMQTLKHNNKPFLEKSKNVNWRDSMSENIKILVSEDELICTMTDVWEDYI